MRSNRFFTPDNLETSSNLQLSKELAKHIVRVLRMKEGAKIELFNGDGNNYQGQISIEGKQVSVQILDKQTVNNESPLNIHLGQAISRGERMELTLQKAVELGVSEITPLISERVQYRFDPKRLGKKMQHWQKIIESACEQCGRARVPKLHSVVKLTDWVEGCGKGEGNASPGLLFEPKASKKLTEITVQSDIRLLVGPEGGFSDAEIHHALTQGNFSSVSLGPRILRTETAALAAISILQAQFGDL